MSLPVTDLGRLADLFGSRVWKGRSSAVLYLAVYGPLVTDLASVPEPTDIDRGSAVC
jgi:hypothetical protein